MSKNYKARAKDKSFIALKCPKLKAAHTQKTCHLVISAWLSRKKLPKEKRKRKNGTQDPVGLWHSPSLQL